MMLWLAGARAAVNFELVPAERAELASPKLAGPLVPPAGRARAPGAATCDADVALVLLSLLHAANSRQPAITMAPLSAPRLARTACVMPLGRAGRLRGSGSRDNRSREVPEDRAARSPGGDGAGTRAAGDGQAQRRRAPGRHGV